MKSRSLFLFRRDLRLDDNTALNEALRTSSAVVPVFIIDPQLLARWSGARRRLAFLFQSLAQLEQAISDRGGSLVVRVGDPAILTGELANEFGVDRVYINREYTPFGRRRDSRLQQVCADRGLKLVALDDALLNPPPAVLKDDGQPYTVFTPYFRRASQHPVSCPAAIDDGILYRASTVPLQHIPEAGGYLEESLPVFEPGVAGAQNALARLPGLGQYDTLRDVPASGQTSYLSAHLRFGTCSVRQVYAAVSGSLPVGHPLIRQLYWRDFYTQIAWHFPRVFGHAFRRQYDAIPWRSDAGLLQLWKEGQTGFPIVDAGMRELTATGYMHNRVRMIVASFLTKNLHLDWRLGEAHFAAELVDYDPSVNNGNWQWGASTGCDAQPYFRVFNPWRQQLKFDKDCVYIKQWVPELEPYPPAAIHKLEKNQDFYLPQIADLSESSNLIKQQFKSVAMRS